MSILFPSPSLPSEGFCSVDKKVFCQDFQRTCQFSRKKKKNWRKEKKVSPSNFFSPEIFIFLLFHWNWPRNNLSPLSCNMFFLFVSNFYMTAQLQFTFCQNKHCQPKTMAEPNCRGPSCQAQASFFQERWTQYSTFSKSSILKILVLDFPWVSRHKNLLESKKHRVYRVFRVILNIL